MKTKYYPGFKALSADLSQYLEVLKYSGGMEHTGGVTVTSECVMTHPFGSWAGEAAGSASSGDLCSPLSPSAWLWH